ncbi:MAG: choice-of-anchor M domain-containing protein [Opitutales bacterium]
MHLSHSIGFALAWMAGGALLQGESFWYSGPPATMHIGVEVDPPGSTRLDNQHVDASFVGPATAAAFALDAVEDDSNLMDVIPLDPESFHPYANPTTRRTFFSSFEGAGFDFLGLSDGQTYWELPRDPVPGQIFLGVNTYITASETAIRADWNPGLPEASANVDDKWMAIDLIDAQMPPGGQFALYGILFSPMFEFRDAMATFDGLDGSDRLYLPASGHDHFLWGFTATGIYTLTFQTSTFLVGGFEEWAALEGMSGTSADFTADMELDGVDAGLEYAIGGSATGLDVGLLPGEGIDNNQPVLYVTLPFGIPEPGRYDILYEVLAFDALNDTPTVIARKSGNGSWENLSATVTVHEHLRNHTTYAVTDAVALASPANRFLQLRVTRLE